MTTRLRVILVALAVVAGVMLWPATANAATFSGRVSGTGGQGLFVRPGPSRGSGAPMYTLAEGAGVSFDCYVRGEVIAGYWYTGNIWHHLTSGGWVSDTYIYTGYNGPVPGEPVCGGTPPPSPPPAPSPPAKPWVMGCRSDVVQVIVWDVGARGGLTYRVFPTTWARRVAPFSSSYISNLVMKQLTSQCLPTQARGRFDYAGGSYKSLFVQIQCHAIVAPNKSSWNIDSVSTSTSLATAIARRCQ